MRHTALCHSCVPSRPCMTAQLPTLLQGVEKFQHCRLRYDALLVQLRAAVRQQAAAEGAEGGAAGQAGPAPASLLKRLLAAFGGEHASRHHAGSAVQPAGRKAAEALPPPSAFERAFLQEVQRLRLLVQGSLEQLWLSLLDTTAQLRGLGEELLQVGAGRGRAGRGSGVTGGGASKDVALRRSRPS